MKNSVFELIYVNVLNTESESESEYWILNPFLIQELHGNFVLECKKQKLCKINLKYFLIVYFASIFLKILHQIPVKNKDNCAILALLSSELLYCRARAEGPLY
jgi:hypothetical protein